MGEQEHRLGMPLTRFRLKDIIPRLTELAIIMAASVSLLENLGLSIASQTSGSTRILSQANIHSSETNERGAKMQHKGQGKFVSFKKLVRRADKIKALAEQASPEARQSRKDMNTHVYRRGRVNTKGFFEPKARHPVKCKAKRFAFPSIPNL